MVGKLRKSLHSLNQELRQWYKRFYSFMVSQNYTKTNGVHCLYVRPFSKGNFIILLLYVDDMLILGQDVSNIHKLKVDLYKSFDMKDQGHAKHILSMKITCNRECGKLWLCQEKYIERISERLNMYNAKPISIPLVSHFK